jgi:hypothetical protein
MKNTDNTYFEAINEFASENESGFLDSTNEEKQKVMEDLGKKHNLPELYDFADLLDVPELPRVKPTFAQVTATQLKASIKVMDLSPLFTSGTTAFSFTGSKLKAPTMYGATHKIEAAQSWNVVTEETMEGMKILLSEVSGSFDDFTFLVSTKQLRKYSRKNSRGEVRLYLIAVQGNQTVKIYWAGN